jgi:hypothetical protein
MPYIKPERRKILDVGFNQLLDAFFALESLSKGKGDEPYIFDGDVNYVITRLIDRMYGGRFTHYEMLNRGFGVLEAVKMEFYRRRVAPYEDKKAKENGDVFE